jgi:L-alanine-DL-glutamate epimerase-like enolase superfamily enzyme
VTTTIERIEAIPFRIPMSGAVAWGGPTLASAEHVLVRVTDSDGATGTAEAIPRISIYGETVGSVLAVYETELRPRFCGRAVWDRERFWNELDGVVANHTAKGAFDLALADLLCRRLGVSCHRWLGGYAPEHAVTAVLGFGRPDEVEAECRQLRDEHGIRGFKLKAGHGLDNDVATIAAVRRDQPDALIYVDANHGFDQLQALEFGRRVRDLGVAWVEEPVPADQVLGRQRVAESGLLNVFGDESCTTPGEVGREVLAGRAHLVSMKIARTGYLGSDQIRGFCETVGAPIVIGSQGDSGIGTLTSLAYAAAHRSTTRYPGEYAWFLRLTDDLLAEPLRIEGGVLRVREAPGNGVEIDEAKLDHYRMR